MASKNLTHKSHNGLKKSDIKVIITKNTKKHAKEHLEQQKNRLRGLITNVINHGKQPIKTKQTLINRLRSILSKKPKYQNKTLSQNTLLKYALVSELYPIMFRNNPKQNSQNPENYKNTQKPENSENYKKIMSIIINQYAKNILKKKDFNIENYSKQTTNRGSDDKNLAKNTLHSLYKKAQNNAGSNDQRLVKSMLHSLLLTNSNNSTKNQLLDFLQNRKSLNKTKLNNTKLNHNSFKKQMLLRYGEQMASGEISTALSFVSTTSEEHKLLENIKRKIESASSENQANLKSLLFRIQANINRDRGLPTPILREK